MSTTYLAHHGILGQKWGVRRYQNPDGSYTDAGKKRLQTTTKRLIKRGALGTTVIDKDGNHIGVSKTTLKRSGKEAAIKEAKDPESRKKRDKIFGEEFDRLYESLADTKVDSIDSDAMTLASEMFKESTGFVNKNFDTLMTENSNHYKEYKSRKK